MHNASSSFRRGALACVFALGALGRIASAGTITAVTVSPNPARLPQSGGVVDVTIRAEGSGNCRTAELRYGDGARETIPTITLPLVRTHRYSQTGTYRVQAIGGIDCNQQRETRLVVYISVKDTEPRASGQIPGGTFCKLANCECVKPNIKSLVSLTLSQAAEPGGAVIIRGCGFVGGPGDPPLAVTLYLKNYRGEPFTRDLEVAPGPKDDVALVLIPNDLAEVMDQTAQIQARSGLALGPLLPIEFRAARDIAILGGLPEHRGLVEKLPSPSDADLDLCSVAGDFTPPGGPAPDYFRIFRGATFACGHVNFAATIGDDSGTDVFKIGPLASGWVIDGVDFERSIIPGELHVSDPAPPYPFDGQIWIPSINWWVTPNDTAWHVGYVYIKGPRGVPPRRFEN